MSETLVIVLRAASLLAFAAPMLLVVRRRRRTPNMRAQGHGDRVPVVANVTAFAWFFSILLTLPGTLVGYAALLLALTGCILTVAGAAVVLRSRMDLVLHGVLPPSHMKRQASSRPVPIALSAIPSTSAFPCSRWARRSHLPAGLPS